ncbi:MAG: ParB/RepB/Spo0J family partition protein [Planctomycetaceae bacterium]|nr:ParB/RepB/Spo0J family partition protein [Planctomycetaceae bacterium]
MSKKAQLIAQLGSNMNESAGSPPATQDRFQGFIPGAAATGEMAIDRIMEDIDQPRKTFDEDALQALAANIKAHGVQQPIQLRWSETHQKWLIVYGHRRYRASRIAGLTTIPCTFTDDNLDESTIRVRQLVENCQREDLAPLEMARALEALIGLTGWSYRRMAEELGLTHMTITRTLGLLQLPESLQADVDHGKLAPSVAIDVLRITDKAKQVKAGREIVEKKLNRSQAKQAVNAIIHDRTYTPSASPREKQLLAQTANIAIYRNPDVSDYKIQKELLAIAEQLCAEKAEA